jgi:hypothetical protein
MSAASNFLEAKILDHVLGKGTRSYTSPSAIYLALFKENGSTLANLEAGTLTDEISTSSTAYGRQAVTFSAASSPGGTAATSGTVSWTTATADWGTVTAVAVMDASTSGNVLFYGNLTASKTIASGDTFQISSTNLTVSLA